MSPPTTRQAAWATPVARFSELAVELPTANAGPARSPTQAGRAIRV